MSQQPAYTVAEARSRNTFLAMMWCLSYPGKIHHLPDEDQDSFSLIAETLLDLETSYFTPDTTLARSLATSGARALNVDKAAYLFLPEINTSVLEQIEKAGVGTMLYPDTAATLIVKAQLNIGSNFTLTGPGIKTSTQLQIGAIQAEFWALREHACQYPLGWDVFLIDDRQIIGLPRTTTIVKE